MATTNLGKWMVTNGGDYDASKTYDQLTMVFYDNSTYITLKEVSGITPSDDGDNWRLMAQGFDATALEEVVAKDTEGLAGNANSQVAAQTLIDAIADKVANQLIEKNKMSSVLADNEEMVPTLALANDMQNQITALNDKLETPKRLWTLDEVNNYQINSLCVFTISIETAIAIGITDATDYFQVINIPFDGPYPSQILITASGKQKMYYRCCTNGKWEIPKKVITSSELFFGGTANGIQANNYNNDSNQQLSIYFNSNEVRTLGTYRDLVNNFRSLYSDQYDPSTNAWSKVIELIFNRVLAADFECSESGNELILKWRMNDTDHRWIMVSDGGIQYFKYDGQTSRIIWTITP